MDSTQHPYQRRTNRRIIAWLVGFDGAVLLLLGLLVHGLLIIGLLLLAVAVLLYRTERG